jgi:gas vesicle protein
VGIADDIKNLGDDIVTSYDMRVKGIEKVVKDTHKMLKGFQSEHKEMAADLRKGLKQGETDRLNAFKSMMAETQAYVKNSLKEFSDAHAHMSEELKKELGKYVDDMVNATKKLMSDIQARQKERNTEVADLLQAYKNGREKMAANWQSMAAAMANRRGIKPEVEAEVRVRPVEEAI